MTSQTFFIGEAGQSVFIVRLLLKEFTGMRLRRIRQGNKEAYATERVTAS